MTEFMDHSTTAVETSMQLLLLVVFTVILCAEAETVGQIETWETLPRAIYDDEQVKFICELAERNDEIVEDIADCLRQVPEKFLILVGDCVGVYNSLKTKEDIMRAMNRVCEALSPSRELAQAVECAKSHIRYDETIRAMILFSYEAISKAKVCVEEIFLFPLAPNGNSEVND